MRRTTRPTLSVERRPRLTLETLEERNLPGSILDLFSMLASCLPADWLAQSIQSTGSLIAHLPNQAPTLSALNWPASPSTNSIPLEFFTSGAAAASTASANDLSLPSASVTPGSVEGSAPDGLWQFDSVLPEAPSSAGAAAPLSAVASGAAASGGTMSMGNGSGPALLSGPAPAPTANLSPGDANSSALWSTMNIVNASGIGLTPANSGTAALNGIKAPLNPLAAAPLSLSPMALPALTPADVTAAGSPAPPGTAYTPAQLRTAYGITQLTNQGEGQTIGIVDAHGDPSVVGDIATFSTQFGLSQMDGVGGDPTLTIYQPQGPTTFDAGWATETALDVESVHAMAPKANIVLTETVDNSYTSLLYYGDYLTSYYYPVSVISNSYGGAEFNGETGYDTYLAWANNPYAGKNVTTTFSTGDGGANGSYPAYSPYAVAVGGTSLYLRSAGGRYGTELGWSGSGGGVSAYEPVPAYQSNNGLYGYYFSNPSVHLRVTPDVSMVADPNTGFPVYSSSALGGWAQYGGTSLASPLFAGVVALADQQRLAPGGPGTTLTTNQTNTDLYNAWNSPNYLNDFHDVTSGSNGYSAGPGYDLVTGIGTPKVPQIVNTVLQN